MKNHLLSFLKFVPKNLLSRETGRILRGPWPKSVHQAAIRTFIRLWDVNTYEAEKKISEYETFSEFFARRLRDGARNIEMAENILVSPCDGAIGMQGEIKKEMLMQAKGRPYSLSSFIGEKWSEVFDNGSYMTIYLAPFNYHRVHFPADGEIIESRHFPGTLWPVNAAAVDRIEDLFAVNERFATFMQTDAGPLAVVMVGATCVGRIRMLYDERITNNGVQLGSKCYNPPIPVKKGMELGVFEMGSTVVILSASNGWKFHDIESRVMESGLLMGTPIAGQNSETHT